ncbi:MULTISPECIES: hypothetical protein [Bizionia]|nr:MULTISPECIES: hypothetical protein [Bizionia]
MNWELKNGLYTQKLIVPKRQSAETGPFYGKTVTVFWVFDERYKIHQKS